LSSLLGDKVEKELILLSARLNEPNSIGAHALQNLSIEIDENILASNEMIINVPISLSNLVIELSHMLPELLERMLGLSATHVLVALLLVGALAFVLGEIVRRQRSRIVQRLE
jgi:hypothetical protein